MSPKKPSNNTPTYVVSFVGLADERAAAARNGGTAGQGPLMDFLKHLLDKNSQGLPTGDVITRDNLVLVLMVDEHPNLEDKLAVADQIQESLEIQVRLVNFGRDRPLGDAEFLQLNPFDKTDHNPIVDTGYMGRSLVQVVERLRELHATCRILLHPTSGTAHVRTVMTLLPVKWMDPGIFCVEWPRDARQFIVQTPGFLRDDLVRNLFPDVPQVADYDDPMDIRNQHLARKYAAHSAEEFRNQTNEKIPTPVLITGPSGTGKEGLAEVIIQEFRKMTRIGKNDCLRLNCAALPDELAGSHLFGHMRGAFTGANEDHTGAFEAKRLLFLDEIGDLSAPNQAKLLRVLESGTFIRIGENTERKSRAFVVAATNSPQKLRKDLLFRLAGFHLECPPLAIKSFEHRVGLVTKLSNRFGRKVEDLFEKDAIEYLTEEPFEDGNYRELGGLIRRCVVFRDFQDGRIGLDDLRSEHHKIGKLLGQKEAKLDMQQVGAFLLERFLANRDQKEVSQVWSSLFMELKKNALKEYQRRFPKATRSEKARALGVDVRTITAWNQVDSHDQTT